VFEIFMCQYRKYNRTFQLREYILSQFSLNYHKFRPIDSKIANMMSSVSPEDPTKLCSSRQFGACRKDSQPIAIEDEQVVFIDAFKAWLGERKLNDFTGYFRKTCHFVRLFRF